MFTNSMDAVADRDFAAEFAFCCAQAMAHCSRLAEELVLWSSTEFAWAGYGDELTTGSSALPHKQNPDIAELAQQTPLEAKRRSHFGQALCDLIENLGKPVIAAVNGFALGGGWEIAMCCDIVIASENARFGLPEITLGVIPGGGGIQKLVRTAGMHRAKEIIFTGNIIDAQAAYAMGMVNKIVPQDSLMDEVRALAGTLLSRSGVALSYAKKAINSGAGMSLISGIDTDEKRVCHNSIRIGEVV